MRITMPWGEHSLDLDLPATWTVIFPKPKEVVPPSSTNETAVVTDALARPIEAEA